MKYYIISLSIGTNLVSTGQWVFVSANFPLTRQFRYSDMPPGELVVQSRYPRSGPIPRDGFSSGRYELVYYTQQDLFDRGLFPDYGFTASAV
jgi:hypothetical protein